MVLSVKLLQLCSFEDLDQQDTTQSEQTVINRESDENGQSTPHRFVWASYQYFNR